MSTNEENWEKVLEAAATQKCEYAGCPGYPESIQLMINAAEGWQYHEPCYQIINYVPQHMEDQPKHARREIIPIMEMGTDFSRPEHVVGRAWRAGEDPNVYIFEINPESYFAQFVGLGTLKVFSLSAMVAEVDDEAAQAFWERKESAHSPE